MIDEGATFGNDRRTHPNMERLSEVEQLAEIRDAQMELQAHLPEVRLFAHPFGPERRRPQVSPTESVQHESILG